MKHGATAKRKARIEKFCRAYTSSLNATNAAIAAGYGNKSAYQAGYRLSKNVEVKARIAELQKKTCDDLEITAERTLREIGLLSFANMDDYCDVVNGKRVLNTAKPTRDQMAAVQEITEDATGGSGDGERRVVMRTRFKLADKRGSLELLGRHLKLFTDVVKHEGLEGLAEKTAALRARKRASA